MTPIAVRHGAGLFAECANARSLEFVFARFAQASLCRQVVVQAPRGKEDRRDRLQARIEQLRQEANESRRARERLSPVADRRVYAATARCACGRGFAYDPTGEVRSDKDSPFVLPSQWECSGVLLGTGDGSVPHDGPLPFTFYEVKSEGQPSANEATTRPVGEH